MNYWLSLGTPKNKLIVGIPTYGRSFTLSGADKSPQAAASGPGTAGPITKEAGIMGYQEICLKVKNSGWTSINDPNKTMGPYAYSGNQWIGYDDPDMAEYKAKYIINNNLGGAMFWDLPSDDFNNACGGGNYPIIKRVSNTLLAHGSTCGPSNSSAVAGSGPTTIITTLTGYWLYFRL